MKLKIISTLNRVLELIILFIVFLAIFSFTERVFAKESDSYILYCNPHKKITIELEPRNIPCTNNSECFKDE